jgi:hypothetical protein
MIGAALTYRVTDVSRPRWLAWQRPAWRNRSTQTATWSNVETPPPSAAASTDEVDSPRAIVATTWLRPVVDRLNHLLELQDGWDGPETVGIDIEVAQKTIEILGLIATEKTRPPSISPGQDGSLQLAWYAREFELEIDVQRSGNVTVSLCEHASDQELELTLTSPQLSTVIKRLAAD